MANIPHIEGLHPDKCEQYKRKFKNIFVSYYTVYKEHNLRVLCHYRYTIYCPLNLNLRGLL